MNKKQFALNAIFPYYLDLNICAIEHGSCKYLTEDGRMCVFGKYMLPEVRERHANATDSSTGIFMRYNNQKEVLVPEAVDILSTDEWRGLQSIHDAIAQGESIASLCNEVGLFTLEDLENMKIAQQT